jgi:hypothetical protein
MRIGLAFFARVNRNARRLLAAGMGSADRRHS